MIHRKRIRRVGVALSSLLLATGGCKGGDSGGGRRGGERGALSESTSLLLAEGRWVTTEVFETTLGENGEVIPAGSHVERSPLYAAPEAGDGYTELLWGLLYSCLHDLAETPEHPWYPAYCAQVPDRLSQTDLQEDGTPRIPNVQARSDQLSFRDLCLGHRALEIASSATGGYLYGQLPQMTLTSTPPPAGTQLHRRFPVASASDKASWAMFAADRFRDAALYFTDAVRDCPDTNLNAPPGTATGSTYGELLATGLADAMSSMMEATEVAEKNVLAASQAKRGDTKQEQSEAVTKAWRDRHDSRLEVASMWGPVAVRKFQPEGDGGVGDAGAGEYPVATLDVEGKGDLRAEELIRSTRVNPCLNGMGSWCQEALASDADRGVADIALDLLQALQSRGGNVNNLATNTPAVAEQSALELLRKQGVSLSDLEHAARRIVQHAEVMGQAIVPDPDADGSVVADAGVSPPALVLGTVATGAPASPYYLYAQTVGGAPWDLFDPSDPGKTKAHVEYDQASWSDDPPELSFSNFSVTATALVINERLQSLLPPSISLQGAAPYLRILAEANAYAHELAPVRTAVQVGRSGDALNVWLAHVAEPWPDHTYEDVQRRCGIWVGEAGLECGLTGQINGGRCATERYKAAANFGWGGIFAEIQSGQMPARAWVNGGVPGFGPKERLYWICDVPQGRREVFMAVEVTPPPPGDGNWSAMLPPMSDQTLSSLSRTLAADPVKPQQSALSCAGVPYNVKVALEDELTEAITGQDGIESSFAYYLKLAREATERADQLGEQLVAQGLQLDLRAEQARENLEDLCGGVVDVSKLETAACNDDDKCDIMAMLLRTSGSEQSTSGLAGVSDSELAGVRSCLGIGERAKPVWAALGDQPLCVPQYYPAPGSPVPPPGVCPATSTLCEPLAHMGVGGPRVLTCDGTTSSCTCGNTYFAGHPLDEDIEGQRPAAEDLRIKTISDRLNIFITAVDTKDVAAKFPGSTTPVNPSEGPTSEHPCESLVKLRRIGMAQENPSQASTFLSGASTALPSPEWANLARLRGVAEQIGFTENVFGIPAVTLNGRPWLTLGSTAQGFVVPDEDWPFGPAAWASTDECDLFPKNWQSTPLACGLTTSSVSTKEAGIRNTARLKAAVQVLKGITGTSFENAFSAVDLVPQPTLYYGNLYNAGNLPAWYGTAPEHWIADDGTEMWYLNGPSFHGRKVLQVPEPVLTVPQADGWQQGWLYTRGAPDTRFGGFISPNHLWSNGTACFDSTPTARVVGCGAVASLLRGEWLNPVRAQLEYPYWCPQPSNNELVVQFRSCVSGDNWLSSENGRSAADEQCSATHQYARLGSVQLRGEWNPDGSFALKSARQVSKWGDGCQCEILGPQTISQRVGDLAAQYQQAPNQSQWARANPSAHQLIRSLNCGPATLGSQLDAHAVLDGLELACMAMSSGAANCNTVLRTPLKIDSIEDFPKVRARVECAARSAQESLDRMYLGGVPQDVVNALGAGGAGMLQSFPEFRGEYGRVVAELGARLIALRAQADSIVQKYRDIGSMFEISRLASQVTDLRIASNTIDAALALGDFDAAKLETEKKKLRTRQAISNSIEAVANATQDLIAGDPLKFAKGVVTITNSALQIRTEQKLQGIDEQLLGVKADQLQNLFEKLRLSGRLSEVEEEVMLSELARAIASKLDEMQQAGVAMVETQATIQGYLSQLESIRNQARREAAKVLLLSNDDLGRAYGVNSSMRARMNTLRVRYERARDDAIRLSYMARRSVEQRLGVDMSVMEDDMTLVAAPRSWVDELCTLSGIDYEQIRQGGSSGGTEIQTTSKDFNYADAYVGDWLTKLENFVESYRVDHPFQDASDVAVVSLRDEIVRAKQECELPGWNQLFHSDGVGGTMPEWRDVVDAGNTPRKARAWTHSCSAGTQLTVNSPELESPFRCDNAQLGNCRALGESRAVQLGLKAGECDEELSAVTNSGPARLMQSVALAPGSYWVTWHQRRDQTRLGLRVDQADGSVAVDVNPAAPATSANAIWPAGTLTGPNPRPSGAMIDPWLSPGWIRYTEKVSIPHSGQVSIGFVVPSGQAIDARVAFAAPQLERVDDGYSARPKDYFPTGRTLSAKVDQCEDTDGGVFRTLWDRGCESYCPPGLGTDCAAGGDARGLPKRCYHELKFPVSLEEIEKGALIPAAGFARGNFNYRFDQIALNFVGTAVKDCQGSASGSGCYASNFLQYSLRHGPPYRIRNYEGDAIDAPLFVGTVQQAKGWLGERLVTNPISRDDEAALQSYWRDELRGRPIDGNFALRIYDADGLDFDALEDVQLVLRYRYWTRSAN